MTIMKNKLMKLCSLVLILSTLLNFTALNIFAEDTSIINHGASTASAQNKNRTASGVVQNGTKPGVVKNYNNTLIRAVSNDNSTKDGAGQNENSTNGGAGKNYNGTNTGAAQSDLNTSVLINEDSTTTGMRMQPLMDKIKALTTSDITTQASKFNDISKHWGKIDIATLICLEIVSGVGNNKFVPNDTLTVEQFIKLIIKSMGHKVEEPTGTYWAKPYIQLALQEGIITEGEYKAYNVPITREQMAKLLYNTAMKVDKDPYNADIFAYYTKAIKDYNSVGNSYKHSVLGSYTMGLLAGDSSSKFNPKSNLTRAEGATVIVRLIDKAKRLNVPTPSEVSIDFKNPELNNNLFCEYIDGTGWVGIVSEKQFHLNMNDVHMEELFYTYKAMSDNRKLISGGVPIILYSDVEKRMWVGWQPTKETAWKFLFDNYQGVIVPSQMFSVSTEKIFKKASEEENLGDNEHGNLYRVSSYDASSYDKYLKNYTYELMKVWFGSDYSKAKQLHDKYLKMTINGDPYDSTVAYLNGRQVIFRGGQASTGRSVFSMDIWAKGYISKDNLVKW